MSYVGQYQGTYYDPVNRRLALQLKDKDKQYEIDLIHSAAEEGNYDNLMKAWREEDNAVTHPNARGQNCFHILARFGHYAIFVKLFRFRLDELKPSVQNAFDRGIRDVDKNKQRVLHLCVEYPNIMDLLITKIFGRRGGNAINGIDYKLRTPLHRSCLLGCAASGEILLNSGAFIDVKDINLQTPLHMACINGSRSTVEMLVNYQHKLIDKKKRDAKVAAEEKRRIASRGMPPTSVPELPTDKEDKNQIDMAFMTWLNEKDSNGQTPFEIACFRGHNEAIQVLVEHGAMINFDELLASRKSSPSDVFDSSSSSKPPPSAPSSLGGKDIGGSPGSPLSGKHRSSSNGGKRVVRKPLPFGGLASPEIPIPSENDDPTSPKMPKLVPIENAVMGGNLSTVKLLRKHGAGTSITGAAIAVHHPVRVESLISRSDGICEQCLFRQQWQCGHRRTDIDASTKSTDLPELRSWRTV